MRSEVTVVIPFYRSNQFLHEALKSVQIQENVGEVVIVVDKDGGNVELNGLRRSLNINVVENVTPFQGPGVCRAIGFNLAKCRYVGFLDSDDIWCPSRISGHLESIAETDMAFSFGCFKHFNNSKKKFGLIEPRGPFSLKNFYRKSFTIGCLTVLIDKTQIRAVPPILIKRRNDYLMWEFVIKQCIVFSLQWGACSVRGCLAGHRIHDDSLTHSRVQSAFSYYKFLKYSGLKLIDRIFCFGLYCKSTIGSR